MIASSCRSARTAADSPGSPPCGRCGVCRREIVRRFGLDREGGHVNDVYGGSLVWNTSPPWRVS